ncbi:MAG: cytochrome c [Gammaproteobacteria bacterium]
MKKITLILILFVLISFPLFIWFGVYNIAANDKHWAITNQLIEILRERSIQVRAEDLVVPDNINDSSRITSAATGYAEMCSTCHLAPGMKITELHEGLYPQPPIFHKTAQGEHKIKDKFWVIKNGIKLTGMPAWHKSHTDDDIWSLVAFISKLNEMSAEEYQKMTTGAKVSHH